MTDRRDSSWKDPRTWAAFAGIFLTIFMAFFGYIAAQLTNINAKLESTRDMVLTSKTKIESVETRVDKLESGMGEFRALYYNLSTRLAGSEARLGVSQSVPQAQPQTQKSNN